MTIHRIGPIITPESDSSIGTNINGPSLIRAPEWLPGRLGTYYLYFGHHQGTYIRLAYADRLEGPWTVYVPGTLRLDETPCSGHIASPDVYIDEKGKRLFMYYHGPVLSLKETKSDALTQRYPMLGPQRTLVATSEDGIRFTSLDEVIGSSYMRVFRWGGMMYAIAMPGIFYRSEDGLTEFEEGPTLFDETMRHSAVRLHGDLLTVFYSNAGDCPEHILSATVKLTADWLRWRNAPPVSILKPETDCEGGDLPLIPSRRGAVQIRARQLRDPDAFEEDGASYLLYSIAGEHGIGLAKIIQ